MLGGHGLMVIDLCLSDYIPFWIPIWYANPKTVLTLISINLLFISFMSINHFFMKVHNRCRGSSPMTSILKIWARTNWFRRKTTYLSIRRWDVSLVERVDLSFDWGSKLISRLDNETYPLVGWENLSLDWRMRFISWLDDETYYLVG